ncbi:RBP11-like subunits of RNA polymerase [Terfezia boudieri ATCC MYA-4762]|uniref:DNA-directed RNA polymerases I and III subunit RPAC2 n=1 Tax=Terfezia boudieri ATCC MYA-4762 TaxID=1051890 RepID=A0A3N4LV02_9PEZI|nr:RBP11-like subunits of RNA polymerase [Terfezia boudieri ATCC MYA-4762]
MSQDTSMQGSTPYTVEEVEHVSLDDPNVSITIQSDPYSMSFQIENEDHTLGNALRYIIMRNPEVEFCGYSIPHPSEAKMNIRIQTYGAQLCPCKVTAIEALKRGLVDLVDLCDIVMHKFKNEMGRFGKHEPVQED